MGSQRALGFLVMPNFGAMHRPRQQSQCIFDAVDTTTPADAVSREAAGGVSPRGQDRSESILSLAEREMCIRSSFLFSSDSAFKMGGCSIKTRGPVLVTRSKR